MTYPIDMPSSPGHTEIHWVPMSAVASQKSPFSFQQKTYDWGGKCRMVQVTKPAMVLAEAKEWQAWAMALNGSGGTFYLKDSVGDVLRGLATGTGRVNGASQVGQVLATDGWANSITGLFKKGDWLSLSDRLYSVLLDVNSNGSGQANLTLWPDLAASPADNYAIPYGTNARGVFRLTDFPEYGYGVRRLMEGFTFSAREDF